MDLTQRFVPVINKLFYNIVNKDSIYKKFPFCGHELYNIRNKIKALTSEFFPQLNIKFIVVNNFRISNLFKFKETVPSDLKSSVIYEYCCSCNATYISKTRYHLRVCMVKQLLI